MDFIDILRRVADQNFSACLQINALTGEVDSEPGPGGEYFHAVTAETSQIRVLTSPWGVPGQPGIPVVAVGGGFRYQVLTNADGAAVFAGLRPGEYAIHAESDGELPDDPKVDLHPKGCLDVYLFRALRISGLVTTRSGLPAARIEVQVRSAQGAPANGAMTGPDGRFELRIDRPGEYYLGVNLNHTATRDSPYARWFYPGTEDPAVAVRIVFSGKPEARTYDFSLPDPQPTYLKEIAGYDYLNPDTSYLRLRWEERMPLLTEPQKSCIARVLVHVLERTTDVFDAPRICAMLDNYWKAFLVERG